MNDLITNGFAEISHRIVVYKNHKIKTLKQFIQDAIKTHDNKYNYSKVNYINNRSKVEIICPIHGSFFQRVSNHLYGRGCHKCGTNKASDKRKYTTESFIQKAKQVHNNEYDYSNVEYTGIFDRVKIVCPYHGHFYQQPSSHLYGRGCPKCAHIENSKSTKYTIQEYIEMARKMHGNLYDYSKSQYITIKDKIEIICKKHGPFFQDAGSHVYGRGCPKCHSSSGENIVRVWLENEKIQYIAQKRFSDCKDIARLIFDFHIPSLNLLIEIDGPQHFDGHIGKKLLGARGHTFTKQDYEGTKRRDEIKNQYALKHNIQLLRIPYTNRKDAKNVLSVLKQTFSK